MRKLAWVSVLACAAGVVALMLGTGCGKKEEARIVRAKMPSRFFDLAEEELPATVGITAVQYIDLSTDQSVRLASFFREHEVFKKVRLVATPNAPGCDVVVGGVLEKQGKELYATFRIYQGGSELAPLAFHIPWNPKGVEAKREDKKVEGVYLSFHGVWSRLAIHLADNVLKIGPT